MGALTERGKMNVTANERYQDRKGKGFADKRDDRKVKSNLDGTERVQKSLKDLMHYSGGRMKCFLLHLLLLWTADYLGRVCSL